MTKLSEMKMVAVAFNDSGPHDGAERNFGAFFTPRRVLALIAVCDAASRMRQSTTMGAEREAKDDLDAALKALEAT